jgi:hypothetical protein
MRPDNIKPSRMKNILRKVKLVSMVDLLLMGHDQALDADMGNSRYEEYSIHMHTTHKYQLYQYKPFGKHVK